MSAQNEFDFEPSQRDGDFLTRLALRADRILIKKLSNNDRLWSHGKEDAPGKRKNNQAGPYIPQEQRDGGFFPALKLMDRKDKDADEIHECFFNTIWPQEGDEKRQSRLVHYTSKGPETHLTRVPRSAFIDLLPASWIVIGRIGKEEYECLTIDSGSDEAALLREIFDLKADFLIGEFEPAALRKLERERILDFAEQVIAAWLAGKIAVFAKDSAAMPATASLAKLAHDAFLKKYRLEKTDPFTLDAPGDALREISRSIEWDLFRDFQRRERSVELVRLLLGDKPKSFDEKDIIRLLIDELAGIDALMLSAAQQRKSRAGYSYEHHIEAMLIGGSIPFEKQVIIEAKKRPDFILPSLKFVDSGKDNAATGLILSAKTTLRERWKQVEREMGKRRLFLTTVDENIAGNAIEDMARIGISLVIPESLMKSKEAEYAGHTNVLGFAEFCSSHIKPHLAAWRT